MKYNLVNFCEFDKYAIKSYCVIHDTNEDKNLGDITKVENLPKCDLLTYGFPCQDISVAGLQAGIEEGTRSGLLLEVERLLENCEYKPKFLIMENVKNLVGKKFKSKFDKWILKLEEFGYNTYWKILNAKEYGIPQNRERIFAISIRNDIDNGFEFPEKIQLDMRMGDLLESNVDEKFYINDVQLERMKNSQYEINGERRIMGKDYCMALNARDYKDPKCVRVANVNPSGNGMNGNVFSSNGIAPTLTTNKGEGIKIIDMEHIGNLSGGKWDKMHESSKRVYSSTGISPTLHTCQGGNIECKVAIPYGSYYSWKDSKGNINTQCNRASNPDNCALCIPAERVQQVVDNERVRKLIPLEYWRLMGFSDDNFEKAQAVNSNSQLYKQAGNSIVVNVISEIYKKLKEYYPNDFVKNIDVISLFSGIGAFEKAFENVE